MWKGLGYSRREKGMWLVGKAMMVQQKSKLVSPKNLDKKDQIRLHDYLYILVK